MDIQIIAPARDAVRTAGSCMDESPEEELGIVKSDQPTRVFLGHCHGQPNGAFQWHGSMRPTINVLKIIEWSMCNGDGIVDYGQILDGTLTDADGNGVPDCLRRR